MNAISAAAALFTKSLLMGIDHATQQQDFADATDIENLPYAEAVEYLAKRNVLASDVYATLSDKMKFRAFTASRIADGDLLKRINSALIKNVTEGGGLTDFLSMTNDDLLDKVGMGAGAGQYWETVYRTNVQTAYNAGRALGYEENPPLALEFIAIDDTHTSDYCRPFAGRSIILSYDDPFWQTHYPPLHFNCRSTVRGIYDTNELPENWTYPEDAGTGDGFGSYPLGNDNWWQELDSQIKRASEYGIQGEVSSAEKSLKINDSVSKNIQTIKDAEKTAEDTFINTNIKDGIFNGEVDYSGINIENANKINETLVERYKQFPDIPKLNGIKSISPNSKIGKIIFKDRDVIASYDQARSGIFLNNKILKDQKTFTNFIKEAEDANKYLLNNFSKLSIEQKAVVNNYIKAGRNLVDGSSLEGIINHEFAHHVELNYIRPNKELYTKLISNMNNFAVNISGYATSRGNEYLAESIAAYIKGESTKIDPMLLSILNSKNRVTKGIKAIINEVSEINCKIPIEKLTKYSLNPLKSPDKARVFKSALDYTLDNYEELMNNIYKNVDNYPMKYLSDNEQGSLFRCDMTLTGPNGKVAEVRTGWIVHFGSDVYQLTTAFVKRR